MSDTFRIPTWALYFAFSLIFLVAEHGSPWTPVSVDEWTADYLISVREGSSLRQIAYLALAATTVALWLQRRPTINRVRPGYALMCGLFVSWLFLSASWSDDPVTSLKRLAVLCIVLFWVCTCLLLWDRTKLILFIVFSTVANLVVCVATEIVHGRFAPGDPDYRLGGTLHPNELGSSCMILVPAALAAAHSVKRFRGIFIAAALAGITAILLTKSRTALAGCSLSVALYLWLNLRRNARIVAVCFSVSVVTAALMISGAGPEAAARLIPRGGEEVTSLNGRIPLWTECLSYAMESPVLGYGYSTFWTPRRIIEISSSSGWGVSAAHSAYLELLLDAGLPGLLLYLCLAAGSLFLSAREWFTHRSHPALFAVTLLCSMLTIGLTESQLPFRSSAIYVYVLPGLLMPLTVLNARLEPERRPAAELSALHATS